MISNLVAIMLYLDCMIIMCPEGLNHNIDVNSGLLLADLINSHAGIVCRHCFIIPPWVSSKSRL
jgi:hypothetical protein